MIITRSPLRISLGGGGTDLPSYYESHEGFLVAAAINKYVYIALHETFVEQLIIKYAQIERVTAVADIQHPIIRATLQRLDLPAAYLELASMADIPAGTGLGSSGSFTTALLKALHVYQRRNPSAAALAEEACLIEMQLGEALGKQDQYIAAFGGISGFHFRQNGQVDVEPLAMSDLNWHELEENLLLFFTGYSRSASRILAQQATKSEQGDSAMLNNLHAVKKLGYESFDALKKGDFKTIADIMNVHWRYKKERAKDMSNDHIDAWYQLALKNGALGGKVVGAGGGGFLLFYTEDKLRLRRVMHEAGLKEVFFRFERTGTDVVNGR